VTDSKGFGGNRVTALPEIRMGIVGVGKMGLLHAAIFNGLPGSRVVAVADPSPLVRNTFASVNASVHAYPDAETMLSAGEVNAVVIATPVADHVPVALECVRRRIPFFVEKPLAASAAQGLDLVAALGQAPTPHMVGYMSRYIEAFRKGRDLLATGCLGRLQRVTATIYVSQLFTRGRGWRYERQVAGGGVLLGQGSHLLDLLTWYFGPVGRVNGEMLSAYSADVEDFAHVMLEFRSGLRGWVDCSWSVRFRRTVETSIEVLGEAGSLALTDDSVRLFLGKPANGLAAGWTVWSAVDLYRGVEIDIGGPQYTREDQAFLQALRAGTLPEPGASEALHVQRIVDAAYESARRRGAPEEIAHD